MDENTLRTIRLQRTLGVAISDFLTAHLREGLHEQAAKLCRGLSEPAQESVRRWINGTRIENLAEWLDGGGWQNIGEILIGEILRDIERCYADQPSFPILTDITADDEPDPDDPQREQMQVRAGGLWNVRLAGDKNCPPFTEDDADSKRLAAIYAETHRTVDWFDALHLVVSERQWQFMHRTAPGVERMPWVGLLARPWLEELVAQETAIEKNKANAKPLQRVPRTVVREKEFVRIGKLGAGMSWAFGGHGVPLSSVDLDGKTFAPQADFAVVPAGLALLPAGHERRHEQTVLALDDSGSEDAPPLAVAIASATQYAISLPAAKLAIYIMAGAMTRKQPMTRTTIRELAERLNPDAVMRKTHYETVFRALGELNRQMVFFPNGISYQAFVCGIPYRKLTPEEYDDEIYLSLAPPFCGALDSFLLKNDNYRGDFLLELTGALSLRQGGPLRQYVRAAAFWNARYRKGGEPSPDLLPTLRTEYWANLTNYLPPAAVEYLRTKNRARGGHVRTAEAVKKILEDAAELEAAGLVVIDKANREEIRLLPPEIYIEAWHKSRQGDGRKADK